MFLGLASYYDRKIIDTIRIKKAYLTCLKSGDTTVTYTYDLNGNLVAEHGGSEDKTYTYDADNRLVTATVSSGNNVTVESYTYDYEDNRISKLMHTHRCHLSLEKHRMAVM